MPAADTLARDLDTQGYAVVRGVFTAGEIASLRGIVDRHFAAGKGVGRVVGYVQPNAAIAVPDLAWLWAQDKVVALLRRALNTQDIVFTGHCDVHRDARFRWHKDSGPRAGDYFNGDYFGADDCRVYKLGIYLDDHVGGASGLKVSPASHRGPAMSAQPPVSLDTRAGDVVLFDVRLSHCGQVPDLVERGLSLTSRLLGVSQGAPGSKFFSRVHALYLRALGAPAASVRVLRLRLAKSVHPGLRARKHVSAASANRCAGKQASRPTRLCAGGLQCETRGRLDDIGS